MFRGRDESTIDKAGRLKIPAAMRQKMLEAYGPDVFLTSISAGKLTIFPLKVWEEKERQLMTVPDSMPEKEEYLFTAMNNGAQRTIDEQGRLTVPGRILKELEFGSEVVILGWIDRLQVMRPEVVDQHASENKATPQTFDRLREYRV